MHQMPTSPHLALAKLATRLPRPVQRFLTHPAVIEALDTYRPTLTTPAVYVDGQWIECGVQLRGDGLVFGTQVVPAPAPKQGPT